MTEKWKTEEDNKISLIEKLIPNRVGNPYIEDTEIQTKKHGERFSLTIRSFIVSCQTRFKLRGHGIEIRSEHTPTY